MRIASLPWYDLAEIHGAHDRFWAAVAGRLQADGVTDVPEHLDRERPYDAGWHHPDLLLGQACGLDAVLKNAPPLQLVGTPHFELAGCDGPRYRSFVIVRNGSGVQALADLRGRRCVINAHTSHSGANALRSMVAPLHRGGVFFGRVLQSGAHEASLAMLQRDEADVAAVDCVTFGLLQRHRPHALAGLRVIAHTRPVAAPPYVTHATTPAAVVHRLQSALAHAIQTLQPALRETLGICGISRLGMTAYEPIAAQARQANALGYRELGGADVQGTAAITGRCVA